MKIDRASLPRISSARALVRIYEAALDAVRADRLVANAVSRSGNQIRLGELLVDLRKVRRVLVVGAGKAAAAMAAALEERLGDAITEGVVVTRYGHARPTRLIRVLEAAHPTPDANSVAAGRAILEMAGRAKRDDLVICLLSGGASALMEAPREGVDLADIRAATSLLLRSGADIGELNAVRACLSAVKAGGLARAAAPAAVVCLALSDVIGNPLGVIGSGPCVVMPSDSAGALAVVRRYGLQSALPAHVMERLRTPGLDPCPARVSVRHVIIGDIWTAIDAARTAALRMGWNPAVLTGSIRGEAREAGRVMGAIAGDLGRTRNLNGIDCCIAGGETTVTVRGPGSGGRSQELACAAAHAMEGIRGAALLAAGTDGADGPTDAAGAIVDGQTMARARAAGADWQRAMEANDTFPFLDAAGSILRTGPTDSNVGDLVILAARLR